MRGKVTIFLFISIVTLASMAIPVFSQEPLNVSCIRQFEYNWHGPVTDVKISGNYAFVGCEDEGMRIVDISQPELYRDVAHLDKGNVTAIGLYGQYAYLGSSYDSIFIADVSSKSNPQIVASIALPGYKVSIKIFGDKAYICTSDGLRVFDISNPIEPILVWSFGTYEIHDVAVRNDTLFVTGCYENFKTFDISDISSPMLLGVYNPGGDNGIDGVSLYGNYAVLAAAWHGFEIVDINTMQLVSRIDSLTYARWIDIRGDYAYLAYGYPECPLAIINISNPEVPQITSIYTPPEDIANFAIAGEQVLVADYRHGLRTLNISDPVNPVESRYNRFGSEWQTEIHGNMAFVLNEYKLTAIDITDPIEPAELGNFESMWELSDFEISGNIAYVLCGEPTELYSVDFTDASNPILLDTYVPSGYRLSSKFAIYNNYIYINFWDYIQILDITDPTQIAEISTYNIALNGADIFPFGHYAAVQGRYHEIEILDLQNPIEPTVVTTSSFSYWCHDIKINGNTLYAVTYDRLWIYDISDLYDWNPITNFRIGANANYHSHHCDMNGNLFYLVSQDEGLTVYDITAPVEPQIIGYFDTPGWANSVSVKDNTIVIADRTNLGIYEFASPQSTPDSRDSNIPDKIVLHSNYPNPFNNSTLIRFDVGNAGNVAIDILDILGRKVTTLTDGSYQPGHYSVRWDGCDENNQVVSSGQYYVRVQSGNVSKSQAVTLLK